MNKEIQLLYKVFELDLAAPLELVNEPKHIGKPSICNKHSKVIGWIDMSDGYAVIHEDETSLILKRVKQIYNVDKLSDDDVYHIAKHLANWLQSNFITTVNAIEIRNKDTLEYCVYRK